MHASQKVAWSLKKGLKDLPMRLMSNILSCPPATNKAETQDRILLKATGVVSLFILEYKILSNKLNLQVVLNYQ